ncbi:MAG: LamG domain-containing protein, partial [Verrucomicrobiota bacterium]
MRISPIFFLFAALVIEVGCGSVLPAQESNLLMPLPEEHTSLWWKEGFPGVIETAPWQQCLETGLYRFVFDSENLSFPHFGSLSGGASLESLDPAELALELEIDGKIYRSKRGGEWSRFTGPRLIASGTFLQRFDVTDLVFEADDGSPLNFESRLEVMAWHDLLSLTLFARPGEIPLQSEQASFGKVGGGFGLDGTNRFDIPAEAIANPAEFSLSFEVFVPTDFQPTDLTPWLLCKGANELADGNLGVLLNQDGLPSIRINRGGGRENAVTLEPDHRRLVLIDQWNHFLLTYDGTTLLTFLNGNLFARKSFETPAPLKPTPITFGQRGDGFASGYPFRGIIDEVQVYSKIVDPATIRNNTAGEPTSAWSFDPNGKALEKPEREIWPSGSATVTLTQEGLIRSSA